MLSVVIPTRNEEKNIKELLENIKKLNDPKDYEIIVVDGYSTDNTRKIAKKYGARVILQDKKLGVANAKNCGVKAAKSDIILFLEADHRIKEKDTFKKLEKIFRKNNFDAATVFIYPLLPQSETIKEKFLLAEIKTGIKMLTKRKQIPQRTTISMIKKDFFIKLGGYDERLGYGEDQEFAIRVRKFSKNVGAIREPLIYCIPILSFKRLFKQAMWYGRNLIDYVKVTKDYKKLLWVFSTAFFFPLCLLSFFSSFFIPFALVLGGAFLIKILRDCLVSSSLLPFLAFFVKIIRCYGEICGMLSRLWIKHKGI